MSASSLPPGGGPEPAPAVPSLSDGGDEDHDHDHDFSPLLDLLERFPDLCKTYVLVRLDPIARASLVGAGSAFLYGVFPRSIFPFGLPARAEATGGAVRVFKVVVFIGSIERLAWAKANGCPWTADTFLYAAVGGNLEVLHWMWDQGCPWNETTSSALAGSGHLPVLRWAREHDCPWGESTCCFAALGGHLAVLQWARAHGYPWSKRECEFASQLYPETLAWVRQQLE